MRAAVVVVVGALWVGVAAPAAAYTCTRAGANGPSLFWRERHVVLQRSGVGHELGANDIERVMAASAQPWTDIDCSDVEEAVGAPTDDRLVGFDWAAGVGNPANHNIVVFRNNSTTDPVDAWEHELGALAITTVTFESNEGRLLDADVEINDAAFEFTACEPGTCTVRFDLQNTLTHEFGHVLGLDHTQLADATMFPSAPEADLSKRTLGDDDVQAICFVYPPGVDPGECYGVPRVDPPNVRFSPTVCGEGGNSAPPVALVGLLILFRRASRRSFARLDHK